jgi:RNA polymerase sigma-70 factor (ECF subfamily)
MSRHKVQKYSTELFLKCFLAMDRNEVKYADDAALTGAVAQGRKEALDFLIYMYMPIVSRTSYRILCDRQDSEVVTQEVFLHVRRKARDFDSRYALRIWIYMLTCRMCWIRLHRRSLLSVFSITPPIYETSAPLPTSPAEDFITKETWEIFCRASANLSSRQRIIFTLCDLEELSIEEVKTVTGLSLSRINHNLDVARLKIRSELEVYGKVR